ncbi:pilus assembly protein [Thauera butanivorans]|uniref:pilus assembly protein n=1 Tax=Thauera butanivorans TaxID=86174 RepID=UPI003AB58736
MNTPAQALPRFSVFTLAILGLAGTLTTATAAPLDVSQVPPALGQTLAPNILYIQDDSGSMQRTYMPDSNSSSSLKRYTSHSWNGSYFNPDIDYLPPLDHKGESLGNASFTDAWENGYLSNRNSYKRNLSTKFRVPTSVNGTSFGFAGTGTWPEQTAFYHEFSPPQSGCSGTGSITNDSCYVKRTVTTAQRQNFANWYSYYRSREMASKAGISRAFAQLGEGARLGYGRINKSAASTIDGKSITTIMRGVREFSDVDKDGNTTNNRKQFFDWLFALNSSGNTPLRRALDAAGQYYENDAANGPWSTTPGVTGGNLLSCRKSFTILMTDGYWNDAQAATSGARENNDGGEGNPFEDEDSNTLADIAWYYWSRDLLGGLENRVPPTTRNPATWQHMATYTISMGFEPTGVKSDGTTLTSNVRDTVFAALGNPSAPTITWPTPGANSSNNIADLLHAAVNGRGDFFSAGNPEEFAAAMLDTLASISDQVGAIAPLGQSSSSSTADTMLYQAKFDTSDWSGWLTATEFDPVAGNLKATTAWTSSLPGTRNILTYNTATSSGASFQWANISDAQKDLLGSKPGLGAQGVLNWVRGNQSQEEPGGSFRKRKSTGLIGDIVNSKPLYIGARNDGYAWASGIPQNQRAAYQTRLTSDAFRKRQRTVYVGANDGMLHAFNTGTYADDGDGVFDPIKDFNNGNGVETFAYVPAAVYANLPALAHPDYVDRHLYFVDGSPVAGDAWIGGTWKTVLVGSTGAGGRSYFALDIETPSSMNASKVLWEFTHDELGLSIGQATIARVGNAANGRWVAIFGNGYNSSSHRAQLFIVDLSTGELIKAIDTGVGNSSQSNGLAAPQVVDVDLDGNADLVYAGDYRGNLWKFDLRGATSSAWKVAFGGKPLFKATDSAGNSQPITVQPTVRRHPSRGGLVVYFGTGKLMLVGDQGDMSEQALYGIFDLCGSSFSDDCASANVDTGVTRAQRVLKSELLEQDIYEEGNAEFDDIYQDYRLITQNALDPAEHRGFFITLTPPSGIAKGERVTGPASVAFSDRVIFTTILPNDDPCEQGADGWLIEIDPFSGGRTDYSVFDMNRDGLFNGGDRKGDTVVSGQRTPGGATPAILHGADKSYKIGTQTGANQSIANKPDPNLVNRQSWQQIQ